jgi:hypothetical protein
VDELSAALGAQNPGSSAELALRDQGYTQGICGSSAVSELQLLNAQLQDLRLQQSAELSQLQPSNNSCMYCYGDNSLHLDRARDLGLRALQTEFKIQRLLPALTAAGDCRTGSLSAVAAPASWATLEALAKRYHSAQPEPERVRIKVDEALTVYQAVAAEAARYKAQMPKSSIGRKSGDLDPGAAAKVEYLQIKLKELSPRHQRLEKERALAAEQVALQVLASIEGP